MTTVIAHRGARSLAPENTLVAAELACKMGAPLWETDVNITQDGHLILFHDQTLDRCTDVKRKFPNRDSTFVSDYSLVEILQLDAGSYFIETDPFGQIKSGKIDSTQLKTYWNERIPTLEQGLDLVIKMDWAVNLELKSFDPANDETTIPDSTLDTIRKSGISYDKVKISSFNLSWLTYIKQLEPRLEVQALLGDDLESPLDFGDYSFETYNINALMVTQEEIALLQSFGKKLNLFTVNNPQDFKRFSDMGVDGIFTDFPQWFLSPDMS